MSLYAPERLRLALVRPLPQSFLKALQQHPPASPIDVTIAHEQHEAYCRLIQEHVDQVIEVSVDENHPDCCFIEDTALVVGDDVIITRIGAESRRGESVAVAKVFAGLVAEGHKFNIHHLSEPACLDGGDVLQMAGRLFVGLSARTNSEAVNQLNAILPGKVVSVPVAAGLHLKSVLSAIDDRTLIAADTPGAREMAGIVMASLPKDQDSRCIWVPDVVAANLVRLGRKVLIQAGYPRSEAILEDIAMEIAVELVKIDMSELVKADGALTCCSLLIP